MIFLRIAIPSPLRRLFDYLPEPETSLNNSYQPGLRVLVPFGNRQVVGVLISTTSETDVPANKLKPIIKFLDQNPVLPHFMFELALWSAQ